MTRFTVTWNSEAEDELVELWLRPAAQLVPAAMQKSFSRRAPFSMNVAR